MKKNIIACLTLALAITLGCTANAQKYALHFGSTDAAVISDGDTINYTPADWEVELGMAYINFYVENLTGAPQTVNQHVDLLTTSVDMAFSVCAAGQCMEDQDMLPNYIINPNSVYTNPITIEPHFSGFNECDVIFKVTVGDADGLENAVTAFIHFSYSRNGISDVNQEQIRVYPNPTRGHVTIGDTEYDLRDRPAGMYILPYKGSAVRVIKL